MNEISAKDTLEEYFTEFLELPTDANEWLLGLWDATQFLDDVADKDDIDRRHFDNVVNQLLVQMPANGFYNRYSTQLLTALAVCIAKWQASDRLERINRADEKTYMWRAGFYDVILLVTILCHGLPIATELAPDILSLYGETYDSYKEEFKNG